MSVMGFQKKKFGGWVGGVSSIQVYFWNCCNFVNKAPHLPRDFDRIWL